MSPQSPRNSPGGYERTDCFFVLCRYDTIINAGQPGRHGWAAGWVVLNGSDPRQLVQRGAEPLVVPTMPWELQTGATWNWTQAVDEGGVPMIGATNGLMPLGDDAFIAWACASDSVVEAFHVQVSRWYGS